jgi:cytochrome o ubiquinol oxidase subunit 1
MIIGVALFGIFAGITYWFPKIFGFTLNERLGKRAFWLWLIGFYVSFIPLYLLGFMGAPRRIDHYAASTGWQPFYLTAVVGFIIIASGMFTQVWQIIVSCKESKKHLDKTGDPWNGRTLEWSTSSPPPFYNFAKIPTVTQIDAFWHRKETGQKIKPHYEEIVLPKNTAMGIYLSAISLTLGFALVWHILGLALVSLLSLIACLIHLSWDEHTEYELSASQVEKLEKAKKAR